MKIILVLVLIMAGSPKQSFIDVDTLDECWERANAVVKKINLEKMQEAGVEGVGAGCIVFPDPKKGAG